MSSAARSQAAQQPWYHQNVCNYADNQASGGAGDSPALGVGQANRLPHQVCRQEPVVDRIDALPSTEKSR